MAIQCGTPTGKVTIPAPGTPVRVTAANPDPEKHVPCHGILIQVLPTNTGKIYIGRSNMNAGAFTGLFAMLPAPSASQIPSFSAAITLAPNAMGPEEFYLDADIAGEGVIVTILIL